MTKIEYINILLNKLKTGGNYGYTFRVMPQTNMMLDTANLDLIQWVTR